MTMEITCFLSDVRPQALLDWLPHLAALMKSSSFEERLMAEKVQMLFITIFFFFVGIADRHIQNTATSESKGLKISRNLLFSFL